jgi:hypothetical protein
MPDIDPKRISFICEVPLPAAHALLRQLEAWAPTDFMSAAEDASFHDAHGLLIERLRAALRRARGRDRLGGGLEPTGEKENGQAT